MAEGPQSPWIVREIPAELPLLKGVPPLVALLLAQRGFQKADDAEAFLDPKLGNLSDPFLLPDMQLAVDRILAAIDAGEEIVIYGDYDVDGVTSITLLKTVLRAYGSDAGSFLPHRMDEGYGISFDGIERCLTEFSPKLFIGVDCGTTSIAEIGLLRDKGIDVIICDHHEASPEGRPPCVALVNPKLGESFHYLCTVGVIFKLAHALLMSRPVADFRLRDYLDIVALGTVADIVPLEGENRALVRRGLHELQHSKNPGLAALREVSGIEPPFVSMDIGFRLGPRLNAAGRLDTAQDALDLLTAESDARAWPIAQKLDLRNRERQLLEKRIREEAEAMVTGDEQAAIVVASDGWHPGVVGIVASRICGRHHRPTFVISIDENGVGKGSGRSIEGVSLVDCINECRDLLVKGGGHAMAAGISIERDKIDAFRERFAECVLRIADEDTLQARIHIDAEARLEELDFDFMRSYERLEPFGAGNPQPVFLARGLQPADEPRLLKEKHWRFRFRQRGAIREGIFFNGAEEEIPRPPWDVAFSVQRNVYRGRVSVQLLIQAMRHAQD